MGQLRTRPVTTAHVVAPDALDDPTRPSGGNTYDRRICTGLSELGWSVRLHTVPGPRPGLEAEAPAALAESLDGVPDGSIVVLDGLVASWAPEVVVRAASRLRVTVLVHTPLAALMDEGAAEDAHRSELAVLSTAAAVLTTSAWTRRWLLDRYELDAGRVHTARAGTDTADLASGTTTGGQLLCVAAIVPGKGHDQLVQALAQLTDLPWRCTFVGALHLDRPFVRRVMREAQEAGIADRLRLTGPLREDDLDALYAAADAVLLASRFETYGLVVTEALARGLPVVAARVGGVAEALGRAPDGTSPGLLVPADDPEAFAGALRSWLCDAELRAGLRRSAHGRRLLLAPWSVTARRVADVLEQTGAEA